MTAKQKKMLGRIALSALCYILLLALGTGGILAKAPAPLVFTGFLIPYLIIGYDVILKAFRNIKNGQVFDENFLMMIATFAAFAIGEYSESVAVMLFYQVGELFQSYAVGKSRQSIAEMMSLAPDTAFVEQEGRVIESDPEDVNIGDILLVRPGEKIPLDGVVTDGSSFIDTSALTGESVPRRAGVGDTVISGCINGDGTLRVRATKTYENSTAAKILELVETASEKKARLENFITRFARIYTPIVTISAAILAILPPLLLGQPFGGWIKRACIFLIVSCPCALVISVPLGFFGGIGAASKRGVLVKGSSFLETLADMTTIVMDKTGTLTKGEFAVQKVVSKDGAKISAKELLSLAAKAEHFSTHPIAKSVLAACEYAPDVSDVIEANAIPGKGVSARLALSGTGSPAGGAASQPNETKQSILLVGNDALLRESGVDFCPSDDAGTVLYVALNGTFLGTIVIDDAIKDTSPAAIAAMKKAGITECIMLTGDNEVTAKNVAASLKIDRYFAQLLPQDKVSCLESIMKGAAHRVGFVGDGINDAPVLMRADIGIAMGSLGSDAAIEAADIVIMDDNLMKIPAVRAIAQKTVRIVRENIVFAIGVKLLVLLLGAAGLAAMWAAVFADVGVAVLAILNSMRLLKYKPA